MANNSSTKTLPFQHKGIAINPSFALKMNARGYLQLKMNKKRKTKAKEGGIIFLDGSYPENQSVSQIKALKMKRTLPGSKRP